MKNQKMKYALGGTKADSKTQQRVIPAGKMDMLVFPHSAFPFFRALSIFLSTFRTAASRLLNPGCEELMKESDVVLELAQRARAQP